MQDFVKMRGSDMIIFVPEELDHHGAEKIRREADQLMGSRRVKQVIFDFRETVFMDSAGIGMIMGRYKPMQSLGVKGDGNSCKPEGTQDPAAFRNL